MIKTQQRRFILTTNSGKNFEVSNSDPEQFWFQSELYGDDLSHDLELNYLKRKHM